MDKSVQVCIIGAGAAGMMCAIEAAKRGKTVLLIDKADQAGKKILISGGGRCNFTNLYTDPDAYISNNEHFCKSALARYTQWDFISFMENKGLTWQEKKLGQLFCDQKATAVRDRLVSECKTHHVEMLMNCEIQSLDKTQEKFQLQTSQGSFATDSLIIACGGPSIPRMGATDYALQVAKQFGIKSYPFHAALVPFTFQQQELDNFYKELSGLSLDVLISCNGKAFRENILFTHRGISGPAILQISSYWNKGDSVFINLLPDHDIQTWLASSRESNPDLTLKNLLNHVFPKRFAERISSIYFNNKPLKQYTAAEFIEIATQLSEWELKPSGTEGMRTAEVALGGINTNELSSKTFESNKIKGLYFIGESIDVTGHLGGYNFQWAWSSGWCAGQYV